MKRFFFDWLTRTAALILLFAAAAFVLRSLIPYAVVNWDEGSYMWRGYIIFTALRSGDSASFFTNTLNQYVLPPFQSWFLGLVLFPFGFTIENARIANLFWFLLGGFLIYMIAPLMPSDKKSLQNAGFIALWLYAVSPIFLVLAGLNLKEMIGTALTLAVIFSYFHARETGRVSWALLTGTAVALLILTKYNYAGIVIIAITIERVIGPKLPDWNKQLSGVFATILTAIATVGLIWMLLEKTKPFMVFTLQNEVTVGIGSVGDKILFYPRAILYLYTVHPILGLIVIASLGYSLLFIKKYYQIRFLVSLILINAGAVGLWTNNLHERYIATVVPALFLLTAWTIQRVLDKYHARYFSVTFTIVLFTTGLALFASAPFRRMVYATGSYSLRFPVYNELDYRDLWFTYDKSFWTQTDPWQAKEHPRDVFLYALRTTGYDRIYGVIGYSDVFSPKFLSLLATEYPMQTPLAIRPDAGYIVTIEILPISRYYTREFTLYNLLDVAKISALASDPDYRLFASKTFEELGVRVNIYEELTSSR